VNGRWEPVPQIQAAKEALRLIPRDNRPQFMAALLADAITAANGCLYGSMLELCRIYIAAYDELRRLG
jgi:hypothetical protein